MLRGYWCIVLAAVGWLILTGAHPPDYGAKQNDGAKKAEKSVSSDPSTPVYAPYPNRDSADCYNVANHDSADLCAQWRAAIAAEKAASAAQWADVIAALGAILSFASVILVLIALAHSRQSNRIARLALKDSRLSSQRSYNLAREASAAQLRPYLQFTDSGDEDDGLKFQRGEKIPFAFQNFGQTPANNVEISLCWEITKRPIGPREITHFTQPESYGTVAPGQKVNDAVTNDFTTAEIARIAMGEVLIFRIRLDYQWGVDGRDCHDLTYTLSSDGFRPWRFGQISKQERHRA
jgi:hypothetical protein